MQITLLLPELALSAMALILFFCCLGEFRPGTLAAVATALAFLSLAAAVAAFNTEGNLFFGTYRIDALSQLFKVILTVGLCLVLWLGPGVRGVETKLQAEYYMFLSVSTLGLVMLTSSNELLTLVMSMEIAAFALALVIPFRHMKTGLVHLEAAIKYFLFGVLATGIMLYGMSYLFGLGRSTFLADLAILMPKLLATEPLAVVAVVLTLCGFFYKLAMFPMHFLTPDVYEGSAVETAAFIATLPKIAAVAVIIRFLSLGGFEGEQLILVLAVFAVLSMTAGNLAALVQNDLKRLLAYSSIAHAGYVMIGVLSGNDLGLAASVYYMIGYLLMNLACFYVIYHLAPKGKNLTFVHLRGLHRRSPLLAFTLAVGAFGLCGIPPTIGFTGKFLVFTGAIQKGYYWLVVLAVINTAVSVFYYLNMVRVSYRDVDGDSAETVALSVPAATLGIFLIVSIILTGVLPQPFIASATKAVVQLP